MAGNPSRCYVLEDIEKSATRAQLTRPQLIALVEAEPRHIPQPFNRSKIKRQELVDLLLASDSPFRTTDPLPTSIPTAISEVQTTPLSGQHSGVSPNVTDKESNVGESDETLSNVEVSLYIEDDRFLEGFQKKTSKVVIVDARLVISEQSQRCVYLPLQKIVQELQSSNGAISGTDPIKIGVQDPVKPEFTNFFVAAEPSNLSTASANPEFLVAPFNEGEPINLDFRVDYLKRATLTGKIDVSPPHSSEPQPSTEPAPPVAPTSADDHEQIIKWLQEKLLNRPGYEDFKHMKNRVKQNRHLVQSWKFAAEFSQTYFKQMYMQQKIKKQDIYKALGVGETSLCQAEDATRILCIFGAGGTHEADEVVAEILHDEEKPKGSVHFFKFLKDWDRNHHPQM